jgi:aminopeptidase N
MAAFQERLTMLRAPFLRRLAPMLVVAAVAFAGSPVVVGQRLPLLGVPEHYQLRVVPDLRQETFAGEVAITIRILQPTSRLVLNAAELTITSASLTATGRTVPVGATLDPTTETLSLALPEVVQPGLVELHIAYTGVLNRQLRGFYVSEANGRKYAVTQLEATDARRMFPSFDEPAFKATFEVTAVIDTADTAISNGPVVATEAGPTPGKQTIHFATTPKMSTYLVALAVGNFVCQKGTAGATPLRICATPGNTKLVQFALRATSGVLDYYNTYFALDYPFAKLDQVAIPDFAAGAMENTAAIFYRESILLVDSPDATLTAKKRAASVVAHEIAHHWFGDLVTMRWWDDIWLNEGFATWMEVKALEAWKPEWDVREDELQSVQHALGIDALQSTRPIRAGAETPAQINELFDPIAYEKGAAILRMVESYVGEQTFRGGVNAYIASYAYDNATAEDFWRTLTTVAGKPVDRIMSSFVDRPGVPMITVGAECRGGRTTVSLTQERFGPQSRQGVGEDRQWTIPVCLRTPNSSGSTCELLSARTATTTFDGCVPWVIANAGARGYYRTAYSETGARALASAPLSAPEAIMLLADEWALLRAGRTDVGRFLTVAGTVASGSDSAAVAESAGARFDYVHEYFTTNETSAAYEDWIRRTLQPALTPPIGTAPSLADTDQPARRRAALLRTLGVAGRDPEVLHNALAMVRGYLAGTADLDPTLIDTWVSLAATAGDRQLYQQYLEHSGRAGAPAERYRFLYGLAAFRDPALLRRTVEHALSEQVRTQDRGLLLGAVLNNPAGREIAWQAIRAHWPSLERALAGFGGTGRVVEALGAFCDRGHAAEVRQFFAANPPKGAERTLTQTLEAIDRCAAVATDEQPHLTEWLSTSGAQ